MDWMAMQAASAMSTQVLTILPSQGNELKQEAATVPTCQVQDSEIALHLNDFTKKNDKKRTCRPCTESHKSLHEAMRAFASRHKNRSGAVSCASFGRYEGRQ